MSPYITTKHKYADESRRNMPRDTAHALVALNIAFIALAICAVLGYLFLLNSMVSRSYALKNLQQRSAQLAESQEKLGRDLTSLRSLDSVTMAATTLGLVQSSQFSYAKPAGMFAKNTQNMVP